MAIAVTAVWEMNAAATAANVNGGFWVPGSSGVDWSQGTAAHWALTGGTAAGAGAVIGHASAHADMVGNGLRIVSGTNATATWFQVISVVAGVSITVDRACSTGVSSNIVFNIGGAMSGQNSSETTMSALWGGGMTVWVKAGTYTLVGNWNWGAGAGSATVGDNKMYGYNTTRGDNPTGTNRPYIIGVQGSVGVVLFTAYSDVANLDIYSGYTNDSFGAMGSGSGNQRFTNCRAVQYSTAAHPAAGAGAWSTWIGCEFVSYFGQCVNPSSGSGIEFINCYFHDSVYGIYDIYAGAQVNLSVEGCTFANISTGCLYIGAASAQGEYRVINCTFYGGETVKVGTGLNFITSTNQIRLTAYNNIFYGLSVGISFAALLGGNFEDYNNFYNNTTDRTNIATGAHSIALDPQFTNVGQYKNIGTVSTSGSVLTDTGASFTNVVAKRDFLLVLTSTGGTVGYYRINSFTSTTLTVDNALGTGSGVTYVVIYGKNFAVGANMRAAGHANTGNPDTIAYMDIGAVQRQAFLPNAGDLKSGVVVDNVTGTYAASGGSFPFVAG